MSVGLHRARPQARRQDRHRRRQPAAALLGDVAAQALGAVPVPIYADSVADEMAYRARRTPRSRFAVVEDQEQVDKIISVAGPPAEARSISSTTSRAACATTTTPGCNRSTTCRRCGAQARWRDPQRCARWLDAEIAAARAPISSIILYTSGTTGRPKGVMLTFDNAHRRRPTTATRSTSSTRTTRSSPICRSPGSATTIFSYAQAYVAGFCVNLPGSAETVIEDRREIGTDLRLRAAAHAREPAHADHGAHGGRRRAQAAHVPLLHRHRAAAGARKSSTGEPVPLVRRACSTGSATSWSMGR